MGQQEDSPEDAVHNIPDEIAEAGGRLFALGVERMLAEREFGIAAEGAALAMQDFVATFQSGIDQDVAEHPDLAELNVMLDGFYGDHHG